MNPKTVHKLVNRMKSDIAYCVEVFGCLQDELTDVSVAVSDDLLEQNMLASLIDSIGRINNAVLVLENGLIGVHSCLNFDYPEND